MYNIIRTRAFHTISSEQTFAFPLTNLIKFRHTSRRVIDLVLMQSGRCNNTASKLPIGKVSCPTRAKSSDHITTKYTLIVTHASTIYTKNTRWNLGSAFVFVPFGVGICFVCITPEFRRNLEMWLLRISSTVVLWAALAFVFEIWYLKKVNVSLSGISLLASETRWRARVCQLLNRINCEKFNNSLWCRFFCSGFFLSQQALQRGSLKMTTTWCDDFNKLRVAFTNGTSGEVGEKGAAGKGTPLVRVGITGHESRASRMDVY